MLKVIWQLPQYLLGLLVLLFAHKTIRRKREYKGRIVYYTNFGVSFGEIIFVSTSNSIKHEYGHSKQSMYLGWLYLLIVGLPSITMNILTRVGILKRENYYKRWPENWANKLGDVK